MRAVTRSKTGPDVLFVNTTLVSESVVRTQEVIARAIMAAAMVPAPRAGHATASEAGR